MVTACEHVLRVSAPEAVTSRSSRPQTPPEDDPPAALINTADRNKPGSSGREARELPEEKRGLLDQSLITALGELAQAGELKPLPMSLSKASDKVHLLKVGSDSRLTFQDQGGGKQTSYALGELSAADHALLSRLVARLKPDDAESQARAGIYLELSGDTRTADDYYKKAGAQFEPILKELFE